MGSLGGVFLPFYNGVGSYVGPMSKAHTHCEWGGFHSKDPIISRFLLRFLDYDLNLFLIVLFWYQYICSFMKIWGGNG